MVGFHPGTESWLFIAVRLADGTVHAWKDFEDGSGRLPAFGERFRQLGFVIHPCSCFPPVRRCDTGMLVLALAKEDATQRRHLPQGPLDFAAFCGDALRALSTASRVADSSSAASRHSASWVADGNSAASHHQAPVLSIAYSTGLVSPKLGFQVWSI